MFKAIAALFSASFVHAPVSLTSRQTMFVFSMNHANLCFILYQRYKLLHSNKVTWDKNSMLEQNKNLN